MHSNSTFTVCIYAVRFNISDPIVVSQLERSAVNPTPSVGSGRVTRLRAALHPQSCNRLYDTKRFHGRRLMTRICSINRRGSSSRGTWSSATASSRSLVRRSPNSTSTVTRLSSPARRRTSSRATGFAPNSTIRRRSPSSQPALILSSVSRSLPVISTPATCSRWVAANRSTSPRWPPTRSTAASSRCRRPPAMTASSPAARRCRKATAATRSPPIRRWRSSPTPTSSPRPHGNSQPPAVRTSSRTTPPSKTGGSLSGSKTSNTPSTPPRSRR